MKNIAKYSIGAATIMALAACGQGGSVIKADEQDIAEAQGENPMAKVKAAIEAEPDLTAPAIDPAAANIDPFSGVYTGEQREAFKERYQTIEFSEDRMNADLDETRALLGSKAANTDTNSYADGLKCAAKFDLAAKKGALPAHEAQASAKQVLMVSAVGYETGISPTASEDQREAELNDYREQTYRNYLLVRASIAPE